MRVNIYMTTKQQWLGIRPCLCRTKLSRQHMKLGSPVYTYRYLQACIYICVYIYMYIYIETDVNPLELTRRSFSPDSKGCCACEGMWSCERESGKIARLAVLIEHVLLWYRVSIAYLLSLPQEHVWAQSYSSCAYNTTAAIITTTETKLQDTTNPLVVFTPLSSIVVANISCCWCRQNSMNRIVYKYGIHRFYIGRHQQICM